MNVAYMTRMMFAAVAVHVVGVPAAAAEFHVVPPTPHVLRAPTTVVVSPQKGDPMLCAHYDIHLHARSWKTIALANYWRWRLDAVATAAAIARVAVVVAYEYRKSQLPTASCLAINSDCARLLSLPLRLVLCCYSVYGMVQKI
jgi:hypothetical protein